MIWYTFGIIVLNCTDSTWEYFNCWKFFELFSQHSMESTYIENMNNILTSSAESFSSDERESAAKSNKHLLPATNVSECRLIAFLLIRKRVLLTSRNVYKSTWKWWDFSTSRNLLLVDLLRIPRMKDENIIEYTFQWSLWWLAQQRRVDVVWKFFDIFILSTSWKSEPKLHNNIVGISDIWASTHPFHSKLFSTTNNFHSCINPSSFPPSNSDL